MSDKGGIEFEFPLMPTEEELREMRKEQTREKLIIIDGNRIDVKSHLLSKGWEKVELEIVPDSTAHKVENYSTLEVEEFNTSHYAVSHEGMLIKDTDDEIKFRCHYIIMADFVGPNDPAPVSLHEDTECTMTLTKFIE